MKTYFTKEEVDALIPKLTRIMAAVMDVHAQLQPIQQELEAEQQRIAFAGGGLIDREAYRARLHTITRLTRELERGLRDVANLGGAPKDLGLGLVDFLALHEGAEVNLCWRFGESAVTFWHGLDEGYAGRKPL